MKDECGISDAVQFLENKTVPEDEVLSYIRVHPGEMTQEQINKKFGLSPREFGGIIERLLEIRFILEKNGKVFPTTFAAIMIEAYETLERCYKEDQNSKR